MVSVRHNDACVKQKTNRNARLAVRPEPIRTRRRNLMPLIQVRVIKDVFSKEQKRQIISKLTDAMRGVTWCVTTMMFRLSLVAATLTVALFLATPGWADPFFFSTGSPDGRLGALSQPPNCGTSETEPADDFIVTEATSIIQATIIGLIPAGTPLTNISNVEVEIYHVFPKDSDVGRTSGPPTFSTTAVPTRVNSPGDV